VLRIVARITDQGGAKPVELVEALLGAPPPEATRFGRIALRAAGGVDPLDLEALAAARAAAKRAVESLESQGPIAAPMAAALAPVAD
jgi:hypothetical protein